MASAATEIAAMRRAIGWPPAASASHPTPTRVVGSVVLDRGRRRRRRGLPPAGRRRRTPRSSRSPRPATGPAAAPPSSRSSRATTPAAPARAPSAARRRRRPRRRRRRRPDPRGRRGRRDAARGRRRRRGRACSPTRPRRGNERWLTARAAAAARSSSGSSPRPSTAGSPRPTAPAAGSPAPSRGPTSTGCAPTCDAIVAGVGHRARRRPGAHRARRATATRWPTQPLRVVVDSRGRTPAGARVRDDAAPTWIATADELGADATAASTCGAAARAARRGRGVVLLEGGPTPGRRVPARRAGRPGRRLPRADPARRRRRRRSPAPASRTLADGAARSTSPT